MSEYVTAADMVGFEVCDCGHSASFHQTLGGVQSVCIGVPQRGACAAQCRKSADDIRLAHLDAVVRREVVRELRDFAEDLRAQATEIQSMAVKHPADATIVTATLIDARDADKRADAIDRGQP